MKSNILHIILFFASFISFGQEYALFVSGDGSLDINLPTSQANYRYIRRIYYKSLTPPYLIGNEAVRNTGYHDIVNNATFPIQARYELRYTPNFNGVFVTKSGSFNLNKFEHHFVGAPFDGTNDQGFGPTDIQHFTTYNPPVRIYQWATVLPKYVQPVGLNRERVKTDRIFKSTANTFPETPRNVPYVKWQYQTNSNTFFWKDFPASIKNRVPMDATVEEMLADELTPIQNINIVRVKMVLTPPPARGFAPNIFGFYEERDIYMTSVSSEIISLDIFNPSPEFHSINKKNTTCNYSIDGGFTLNVKRDLNTGEELVITLYDNNNNALVGQQFTTSLTNNGDGTFGYKWTGNLDGGTYKVKFQSHGGTGGINPNDNSWNLLNFSSPFEIQKPQPVSFSITGTSDQTCFNENDGYIDVSATREAGRGLFFQLTKNGNIQVFNGAIWINYTGSDPKNETFYSFSSTTTTRINKLGKGDYRIKVRDSQMCYMRNN